ncbi:hypothetical protein NLG97_g7578 [Lecanicillium saksenae]|uniref:Uncharacterized protein n=1 Tax=Lecanicillium saksenae TaxID=468837 RepID=A0ACC1QMJ1_9HYPO|nr:hypothetical protein NLG97_g7578 [Lecanicillium saksenae]
MATLQSGKRVASRMINHPRKRRVNRSNNPECPGDEPLSIAEYMSTCHDLLKIFEWLPNPAIPHTIVTRIKNEFEYLNDRMKHGFQISWEYKLRSDPHFLRDMYHHLNLAMNALEKVKIATASITVKNGQHGVATAIVLEQSNELAAFLRDDTGVAGVRHICYNLLLHVKECFQNIGTMRSKEIVSRRQRIDAMASFLPGDITLDATNRVRLLTNRYVAEKYPKAPEPLRAALVQVNVDRLWRLSYQRFYYKTQPVFMPHHFRRYTLPQGVEGLAAKGMKLPEMPRSGKCKFFPFKFQPNDAKAWQAKFEKHVERAHGLAENPLRYTTTRGPGKHDCVTECTFCDNYKETGPIQEDEVFATASLQKHVAEHLIDIALLVFRELPVAVDPSSEIGAYYSPGYGHLDSGDDAHVELDKPLRSCEQDDGEEEGEEDEDGENFIMFHLPLPLSAREGARKIPVTPMSSAVFGYRQTVFALKHSCFHKLTPAAPSRLNATPGTAVSPWVTHATMEGSADSSSAHMGSAPAHAASPSEPGARPGTGSGLNPGGPRPAAADDAPAALPELTLPPIVAPSSYLRVKKPTSPTVMASAPETKTQSPLDREQQEGLEAIRDFLKVRTSYDVLPLSFRLIILDTDLLIKKSLNILIQNSIVSAPLWDSQTSRFAGLLTSTDYINVIQYHIQYPDEISKLDQFRLRSLRDIEKAIGAIPIETLSVHPSRPLFEACRQMLKTRARRIPLVDVDDETGRETLISVITQYRILKFIAVNNADYTVMLKKTVREINLGSYNNLVTSTMNATVLDVIRLMVDGNISCIPILDSDGRVLNAFEAVDVIPCIKGGVYEDLGGSVGEALCKRPDDAPGIYTCSEDDRLDSIFDAVRKSRVHRLIVIDDDNKLKGVISLSDILKYVLYDGEEELKK